MTFDVNIKSHRSHVAIILAVCVTVLGALRVVGPDVVLYFLGGIYATYVGATSAENRVKLKNGYAGYINPLTDKAKKLAEEAERLAKTGGTK